MSWWASKRLSLSEPLLHSVENPKLRDTCDTDDRRHWNYVSEAEHPERLEDRRDAQQIEDEEGGSEPELHGIVPETHGRLGDKPFKPLCHIAL